MTGPSLDLDALREKAEAIIAAEGQFMSGYEARRIELAFQNAWTPERCLAVLALVEEQRKALDRLLPYSDHLRTCAITGKRPPGVCTCGYLALLDALAGPPAEGKKEGGDA